MTSLRKFSLLDLFHFNNVNLDILTETYNIAFYGRYLAQWPEYCRVAESAAGVIQGYVLGKVEGDKDNSAVKNWHGHVTAVTVAPSFRKQGLATTLMKHLEDTTALKHNGWFVDLFVRASNQVAIGMYQKMGYSIYRTIKDYYSGPDPENAHGINYADMRKSMPRNADGSTSRPLGRVISASELEFH